MTSLQAAVNELYSNSFVNAHGVRVSDDDLPSFSPAHDSFDALDNEKEHKSDLAMMLDAPKPSDPHKISDPAKAIIFLLAGNAYFTVRSQKTGTRYTFRVSAAKDNAQLFFVSLLTGSQNESDYSYLGIIRNYHFTTTKNSRMPRTSQPVQTFEWLFGKLLMKHMPTNIEFWHEGRCGRCGRKLTVPDSIEAGIGPECATRMQ